MSLKLIVKYRQSHSYRHDSNFKLYLIVETEFHVMISNVNYFFQLAFPTQCRLELFYSYEILHKLLIS